MPAADTFGMAQQGSNNSLLPQASEFKCPWFWGTSQRSPRGWRWLLIFMRLNCAKFMHLKAIHLAG